MIKNHLKTFLIINVFLLSFFFFNKNVHAQNNNEFYLNYDSDVFTTIKSKYDLDNHIEEYKNKCASIYDEYVVSLYYYSGWNFEKDYYTQDKEYYAYMISCIDVSTVSKFQLRYKDGYSSGLLNYSREDVPFKTFRINDQTKNITNDIVQNSITESFIGIYSSGSSPYYLFDNLLKGGFYVLTSIPVYSSKNITIDYADNNNGKLYINNEYIENGSKVKFYYNMVSDNMLSISNTCTSPGECESAYLTLSSSIGLSPFYKYKLELYIDGNLYFSDVYTTSFTKELPIIRNDVNITYKFYKSSLSTDIYELLEEKDYLVDVKFNEPTIIFRNANYTGDIAEYNIFYFVNNFYNDYIFQYRYNKNSWLNTLDAVRFDYEENMYVEARILDKKGNILVYKDLNLFIDLSDNVRFEYSLEYKDSLIYADVYVYNVQPGYTCYYKIDNGVRSDNVCTRATTSSDDNYKIFHGVSADTFDLSLSVYNANGDIVFTDVHRFAKSRVDDIEDAEDIFEFLASYLNSYNKEISELSKTLQEATDNMDTELKELMLFILILICLFTTIRLAGGS